MKVLFVYPVPRIELFPIQYSQGIGYLAAVLKEKGYKTGLLILYKYDKRAIASKIESFHPNLIAVSSTTDQISLAMRIISYIYETYKLPIVLGGTHPTVAPYECINIPGVMGICLGEGEYALLKLVNNLEVGEDYLDVENFWFKKEGKLLIKNKIGPLIEDLDSLPFPDRELFEPYIGDSVGTEFIGSRGCPYQCSYCINPYLRRMYKGKFVRHRTVKNLLDEIEVVSRRYKTKSIIFHDDVFTLNRVWLEEFAYEYPRRIGLTFTCNVRADTITPDVVKLLCVAGCEEAKVGVESGDDYIREKILSRKMERRKIVEACNLLNNKGIRVTTFNMIGVPYERENSIKAGIDLNKEIYPFKIGLSVFRPYPGTELYEVCKNNGWLSNRKVESYFDKTSVLDLPSISKDKISYWYGLFRPIVYRSKLLPLIRFALVVKIFNSDGLYYFIHYVKMAIGKHIPEWAKSFVKRILPLVRWM